MLNKKFNHWLNHEEMDTEALFEDIKAPEQSNLNVTSPAVFTQVHTFFQQVPEWKMKYVRIID